MYFRTFVLSLLVCLVLSAEQEPRCYSRFDWEDKLLDKAIRTEVKMEQYMDKLNGALETFKVAKEDLEEVNNSFDMKFEKFKSDIESKLTETTLAVSAIESGIESKLEETALAISTIEDLVKTPTIAFSAKGAADNSPALKQRIIFQSVALNIGNAYDAETGIFTSPVNGTYLFSVQVCAYYQHNARFQAVVDNSESVILAIQQYDHHDHSSTSNTVPQYLTEGQKVWVQASYGSTSRLLLDSTDCWNQFSGCLVHLCATSSDF